LGALLTYAVPCLIAAGMHVSENELPAILKPRRWTVQRHMLELIAVTVLPAGDAAHPMTFQLDQGLNNGIANAANLTQLLKQVKNGMK
jgi:2-polyprenyl-6-methoxyphenol hydroxylase-like FAD-dependent oxidoreductase